jgi:hypothetical protein
VITANANSSYFPSSGIIYGYDLTTSELKKSKTRSISVYFIAVANNVESPLSGDLLTFYKPTKGSTSSESRFSHNRPGEWMTFNQQEMFTEHLFNRWARYDRLICSFQ